LLPISSFSHFLPFSFQRPGAVNLQHSGVMSQEIQPGRGPFYVHDDAPDVLGFAGLREQISAGANAVTEWCD
jgi:hypothetical protein